MTHLGDGIATQAEEFAQSLNDRVRAVLPGQQPTFVARILPGPKPSLVVHPIDPTDDERQEQPLVLTASGRRSAQTLHLRVHYRCCADSSATYLTIERSSYRLGLKDVPDPLLRVEYDRTIARGSRLPAAHVQLHAHRDETVWLMLHADEQRPRDRWRRDRVPRLAELHLPVGGDRFRPCLEDVLTVAITEFGTARRPGAWSALEDGRAQWRRMQLRAAVRDAPEVAAEALRIQGWSVRRGQAAVTAERHDRLTQI